ncbi:hypothetical protein AAFF_G00079420 [Aldrovandia affinis]|uniref:C-type lectin domain-containing protein n=1 Tax=Aldrovandia affinis TaxID=143900 RepID=A0AAD7RZZ7_9TELE|nr:hypothetical protein AAFF_G00079420 [Aldrovandia affinis]
MLKKKSNWINAQSYCRQHHTDLASVRNQAENEEIKAIISEASWIGLFREPWTGWSDQSKSSYRKWSSGEPNNFGGNENCAAMRVSDSGNWTDLDCNSMLPFICYEDYLILVHKNKSWDEALSYCRKHYRDLVSISSKQLQHWVKRRAQKASTAHVWLGLNYSCKLHFWFWLNGRIVSQENEPGECGLRGAVESGVGKQWASLPKTEKLNFICSKCGGDYD